jgi:hypothetical protein
MAAKRRRDGETASQRHARRIADVLAQNEGMPEAVGSLLLLLALAGLVVGLVRLATECSRSDRAQDVADALNGRSGPLGRLRLRLLAARECRRHGVRLGPGDLEAVTRAALSLRPVGAEEVEGVLQEMKGRGEEI